MENLKSLRTDETGAVKGMAVRLFGLILSFLTVLVGTYIGLYGPELPIEIRWKSDVVTGERLRFQDVLLERNALKDSVENLRLEIARQETTLASYKNQIATIQRTVAQLSGKKARLQTKVAYLQSKTDSLHRALTQEQVERIQRLAKMLKTMSAKKVTQYLLSLDNKTILTLLQISPEKQAATILSALEPSRAAALTRKYVSIN